MDAATRKLIDDFGHTYEAFGLPYNAGRIFALALFAETPLSQQDISTALHISQSVVSVTLKQLSMIGFVERVRVPGDRRAFYSMPQHAERLMMAGMERRMAMNDVLLDQAGGLPLGPVARARVEGHRDMQRYLYDGVRALLTAREKTHR